MSSGSSGKINIVTRVALEGRAKLGDDGASMKMYLKVRGYRCTLTNRPLTPMYRSPFPSTQSPLALACLYFQVRIDSYALIVCCSTNIHPEENVKILSSQVHPLDNNSVPYNFSSTLSPLLHRAACALNLPARSPESFNSAFDLGLTHSNASSSHSSRASRSENQEAIPPVDSQYTGEILVSGYNITYVPPRHFPTHSSEHGEPYPRPSSRSRRASISERATAQFMVAIDMWVPYLTKPTKYPYLVRLYCTRCKCPEASDLYVFAHSSQSPHPGACITTLSFESSPRAATLQTRMPRSHLSRTTVAHGT